MTNPRPVDLDRDWQDRASCLGLNPDIFFAKRGESITMAKSVCAFCGVKAECLAFALEIGEKKGVWGGLTPTERRGLKPVPQ